MARIASGALAAIFAAQRARLGRSSASAGTTAFTSPSSSARCGRQVVGEEADLARLRPADQARQVPGAAALRHDAALGEAGDELGVVAHQADVAAEREVEAVAGGRRR